MFQQMKKKMKKKKQNKFLMKLKKMMKLKNRIKTININNILFNNLLKGFLENNKINYHL